MYFFDHDPPHFHVVTRDRREAQVRISNFTVIAGDVPTMTMQSALAWARRNRFVLVAKWRELHP
jgi:hypothetical protein